MRCKTTWWNRLRLAVVSLVFYAGVAAAQTYSPYVERAHPFQVYWGDTHVHTSLSSHDANLTGGNRVSPEVAYRFAQGEVVDTWNGMQARLRRPLDFLVVADHGSGLGIIAALQAGDEEFPTDAAGMMLRRTFARFKASSEAPADAASLRAALKEQLPAGYRQALWHQVVDNAEQYNDPGRFTAFTGYEWTAGGFTNLHRVVIFRDGPDKTYQTIPFTTFDSHQPENLWRYMNDYQNDTGGSVLAIPHNSNLSGGEMFARHKFGGAPLTRQWAELRNRFEPLLEITQYKGDSEAHPTLSPTDEFADFETWNGWRGVIDGTKTNLSKDEYITKKQGEYARSALKAGLDLEVDLGTNPFKYGIVGGTDSHTSLAAADNDNFWGKFSRDAPSDTRLKTRWVPSWERPLNWEMGAAGYTGVWAHENTRAALFAAMQRREVYASTGPRIKVRFFGGWDYSKGDAQRNDLVDIGYNYGVPMGGDLTHAPSGRSPRFLIHAAKDPDGANLDRVQVIKGWRDQKGQLHEKVYDVALADDRDATGKVMPVGSTVNIENASYSNSIGDAELAVVWMDPGFNASEHAFYYVRVLEIPTPRWPAYDASYFDIKEIPDDTVMVTQERAYTSPIWYTP